MTTHSTMGCIGTRPPAGTIPCRITFGAIAAGTLIALVGAFEPQLSGGAYVLRWGAFMAGLVPYLVLGAFLPLESALPLALTAVGALIADLSLRVAGVGLYGPFAVAAAVAVVLTATWLVRRRRT